MRTLRFKAFEAFRAFPGFSSPQHGSGRLFFRKWFRRGSLRAGHGISSSTEGISEILFCFGLTSGGNGGGTVFIENPKKGGLPGGWGRGQGLEGVCGGMGGAKYFFFGAEMPTNLVIIWHSGQKGLGHHQLLQPRQPEYQGTRTHDLSVHLSAPKSQRFLRFAIAMPQKSLAISETRESNAALRFKSAMESR